MAIPTHIGPLATLVADLTQLPPATGLARRIAFNNDPFGVTSADGVQGTDLREFLGLKKREIIEYVFDQVAAGDDQIRVDPVKKQEFIGWVSAYLVWDFTSTEETNYTEGHTPPSGGKASYFDPACRIRRAYVAGTTPQPNGKISVNLQVYAEGLLEDPATARCGVKIFGTDPVNPVHGKNYHADPNSTFRGGRITVEPFDIDRGVSHRVIVELQLPGGVVYRIDQGDNHFSV
ncbi:MAG: hypothetical protein HY027_24630 [Deltaproteobacteria bacterium]|nr:hypothetical protein [Deltaproteobacteria bacterium]